MSVCLAHVCMLVCVLVQVGFCVLCVHANGMHFNVPYCACIWCIWCIVHIYGVLWCIVYVCGELYDVFDVLDVLYMYMDMCI